ncbi:hypothetical protein SOVF_036640 [Spinacia oleracea]|uniref:Sugar transport protein 5 n=1 Tax=Spinacia oleracea TaxID=3562 RepID=A0A9R0JKV6_SPIOL|nr:sugar transport protein 5 isoform X1 [Spinacia oleracea]XP_056693820.1 sugar transport protein 5 isoform X1 [Spinacia oleracea]KNA22138.1 hypothetical protein SOVF_036640 [Spinacia oleracea]
MAGGMPLVDEGGNSSGKITATVVLTCVVAASGGLIFGYDIGISGGVTTMVPFLRKFFPSILEKSRDAKTNMYCMYDSQALTSFTSSLYIAGLAASLVASRITAKFGRKFTMVLGGCTFLLGGAVNGAAQNVAMLIIGRILLGFGVGFTNQATPVYLSEVAPPKWRGAFNTGFQFFIAIGVVIANSINYATKNQTWGWRLSLGLAIIPATIIILGILLIPDTPNSLVERGKMEEAKKTLENARGVNIDVKAEFAELIRATELANVAREEPFDAKKTLENACGDNTDVKPEFAELIQDAELENVAREEPVDAKKTLDNACGDNTDVKAEFAELIRDAELANVVSKEPFVTIFERCYRPHLVLAILIPLFQQITGINVIAFYAPVLFESVGFGSDSALIAAIILGVVNLGSILVSTFLVDRFGRRFLFLEGGVQMFIFQIAVAGVLAATTTGVSGTDHLSKGKAILVLILMCIYAAGFGWSWGPLSWLIPSEIFPLKIRPIGQSISVAVNFATTFLLSQTFLSMLCHFKFGVFFFYAGWIAIMTVFVALFVPETKGIPLDSMHVVWNQHWYWHKFVKEGET